MKMLKGTGRVRYTEDGWIILALNDDIAKYYQKLIFDWTLRKLQMPKFGPHVTIMAGKYQRPKVMGFWKKYEGDKISFLYAPEEIHGTPKYFWIPVWSRRMEEIRVELGLEPQPFRQFHLTLGNTKFDNGY